jgi:hypothetical protein
MPINLNTALKANVPVILTDTSNVTWTRQQGKIMLSVTGTAGSSVIQYDGGDSTTAPSSVSLTLDMGASA